MAVVTKTAKEMPDQNAPRPKRADVHLMHSVLRACCFTAEIANGDSAGSKYLVAKVPSHARISKLSAIHSSGITGVTDADLGSSDDPDGIADGQTLAGTQTYSLAGAITPAKATMMLWQVLGLEKDPKKELELYLTINTAATADGVAVVELVYVTE